jgi:uroporphyrinogen decarboxylase
MTSRERLEMALRFEEPDRPPHFEQMYELVEEACGEAFPSEEAMEAAQGAEREKLFETCARLYGKTVDAFKWDAVLVWRPAAGNAVQYEFLRYLKKVLGPDMPMGSFIWGSAICIDTVKDYMQFSIDLAEEPEKLHAWAREMLERALEHADRLIDAGCDLIDVANDYAFNAGPFISPAHFAEFTTPYMKKLVRHIQNKGVKVIFHSDGNLMPVLDQILDIGPEMLQSIDPLAGMDIAEVKRLTYGRMALMGNVQCDFLQEGPDEKIAESAKYAIRHGSPGGGYVYSSSNTIFRGLPLKNYVFMVDCLHRQFQTC